MIDAPADHHPPEQWLIRLVSKVRFAPWSKAYHWGSDASVPLAEIAMAPLTWGVDWSTMDKTHLPRREGLSDRQAECLQLAADGLTSKEIGRQIGISPSTVDNHLRAAADRLQVRGRRQAVRYFRDVCAHPLASVDVKSRERTATSIVPPLGGRTNTLDVRQRLAQVCIVALLGIMALAMIAFTITGIVRVLDRP